MRYQYHISGFSCMSCVGRVQKAFDALGGYKNVWVQLDTPQLSFESELTPDPRKIREIVENAGGYKLQSTAVPLANKQVEPALTQKSGKTEQAASQQQQLVSENKKEGFQLRQYYPIIAIFGLLVVLTFLYSVLMGLGFGMASMRFFMGAFFILFAGLKLRDLKGFATAFVGYDPIAKQSKGYAFLYPFIELALGIAFLANWQVKAASVACIILLGIGLVGVLQVLRNKQTIQCACIGTGFDLPMSRVTVIENSMMIAMALAMIFLG